MKATVIGAVGYAVIGYWPSTLYVHRLVALAFHGQPAEGQRAHHKDGNKLNNQASNLEWVTAGENNLHAYQTGLKEARGLQGSANPQAKLTEEIVRDILKSPLGCKRLAARYGVDKALIQRIRHGKAWAHVQG